MPVNIWRGTRGKISTHLKKIIIFTWVWYMGIALDLDTITDASTLKYTPCAKRFAI